MPDDGKATLAEVEAAMIGLQSARDAGRISDGFYQQIARIARRAGWVPVNWMVYDLTASPNDPGWGPMTEEAADAMIARNPHAYGKMATRRKVKSG